MQSSWGITITMRSMNSYVRGQANNNEFQSPSKKCHLHTNSSKFYGHLVSLMLSLIFFFFFFFFHLSWSFFFQAKISNRKLNKNSEWRIYSNFSLMSSSFNELSNSLKISEWVKMLYDYRVTAVKLMKIIWNFYDAFKSKSNFMKE